MAADYYDYYYYHIYCYDYYHFWIIAADYGWQVGAWAPCPVTCGVGSRTRTVRCVDRNNDGAAVQAISAQCPPRDVPTTVETCELPACRMSFNTLWRLHAKTC